MDNAFTRTLRSAFVVGMGVAGIAVGNRVYGRHLLQEMVRARAALVAPALALGRATLTRRIAHSAGLVCATGRKRRTRSRPRRLNQRRRMRTAGGSESRMRRSQGRSPPGDTT